MRVNQRVTAQVMEIANEHVKLLVEGVPIVARLTSPEQAAQLVERRLAQFIVREAGEGTIALQIAPQPTAEQTPAPGTSQLVSRLLTKLGLPVTDANANIVLALIKHGLPVTAEVVDELAHALAALSQTDAHAAELAAALKAAGLPFSPGALELALTASPKLGEAVLDLETQLRSLSRYPLPPQVAEHVGRALETLSQLKLDWSASPKDIAQQLQKIMAALSQPLEQQLAQPGQPPGALMALAQLRAELAQITPLAPAIVRALHSLDGLLDSARLNQFNNLTPAQTPVEGHWLSVNLPLSGPPPVNNAGLRIAHPPDSENGAIDATHTRLVLQIELEAGRTLEVDLAVVERQIGAWVRGSDAAVAALAEAELPSLADGLHAIGYTLKTAHVEVRKEGTPLKRIECGLNMEA